MRTRATWRRATGWVAFLAPLPLAVGVLALLAPFETVAEETRLLSWSQRGELCTVGTVLLVASVLALAARPLRWRPRGAAYLLLVPCAWGVAAWMSMPVGFSFRPHMLHEAVWWPSAICLLAGAYALGAPSSIARVRLLVLASLGLLALSGFMSAIHWPTSSSNAPNSVVHHAETMVLRGCLRPWAALSGAVILGLGAATERRGARGWLIALALVCLAVAGRDLAAWGAAVDVFYGGSVALLEALALGGTLAEWILGSAAALAFALAVRGSFGARGRRARVTLRAVVLALPIGGWALGSVTDPPPTLADAVRVEPRWRAHDLEPATWSGSASFPSPGAEVWLVDADGSIVESLPARSRAETLQILADRRAPLGPLLDRASRVEVHSVLFVARSPHAVALDAAVRARERFSFVEMASRGVGTIQIDLFPADRLAALPAGLCVESTWSSTDCATSPDLRIVDEVPPGATVEDLVQLRGWLGRTVLADRRPPRAPEPRSSLELPSDRSDLDLAIGISFAMATTALLLAAWISWWGRVRARREGVSPRWLSPRARDTSVSLAPPAGYRDGAKPILVHTARSFARALGRSTLDVALDVRPWLALLVLAVLVVLRCLG